MTPARLLVAAALVATVTVAAPLPAHADGVVAADATSAAFVYSGASGAGRMGVQVSPGGEASFGVRLTTFVDVRILATGQTFTVTVDGGPATSFTTSACGCFALVRIAEGLSTMRHEVVVENGSMPLVVRTWIIGRPGVFLASYADAGISGVVPEGQRLSFWVENTASIAIDAVAAGGRVTVLIDDRWSGYAVTLANTGTVRRTTIAWGLGANLHHVVLQATRGTLDLRRVWIFQAWGAGLPRPVDDAAATTRPLLAVYGDSIAFGKTTLGFERNSDGFADRLAAKRAWRLSDLAVDGSSASCYGMRNTQKVIRKSPDLVIIAYGTNDMQPGPDYSGCDPDLATFQIAMETIVSSLQAGLPGVPLYLQTILPTERVSEETRADWNAVLADVAADHAIPLIDPSQTLDPTTDYVGPVHPNNGGHAKIAAAWDAALPAG